MQHVFFDDSKHPNAGFHLAAFVMLPEDPSERVADILRSEGLEPGEDEFKSSAHMGRHPEQRRVRSRFKHFLMDTTTSIGVAVVPDEAKLGEGALELLGRALTHDALRGQAASVWFDEGLFPRPSLRESAIAKFKTQSKVQLFLEQRSHQVLGIQLADVIAHVCAIMLLERLGVVHKKLKVGPESLYPPDTEVELGFQFWSAARYLFLSSTPTVDPDEIDENYRPIADVRPYGLYLHPELSEDVRCAADARFGEMYLGCIH